MTECVSFLKYLVEGGKCICNEIKEIQGVEEEVYKINTLLSRIVKELETAGVSREDDWHWPNILFDAQDIGDIYKTEDDQSNKETFCWIRKAWFKFKLKTQIKEILNELQKMDEENKKRRDDSSQRSQNDEKPTYFRESGSSGTGDFIGRGEVKEELKSQMISKSRFKGVNALPIFGMSGIGKTSLAQEIYNDEKIKGHFGEARMWRSVTFGFQYEKLHEELRLYFLQKGHKSDFLLVLDDVQDINYDQRARLTKLLNDNCEKSILLVTTQSRVVARNFLPDPPPNFDLPELPEEDCLELFRRVAFPNGCNYLQKNLVEKYGREIIQKCGGSPSAVKAIACVLSGNSDDESMWKKILESDLWTLEQETSTSNKPTVLPALKFSYNHLPSVFVKQCFAYCSIFPKGYAFQKEELLKLWMGKAFIEFDPSDGNNDDARRTRYQAENCFNELLERSFFQKVSTDEDRYKLLNLMHELAQSVSSRQCCRVKDLKSCHFSDELLHVSLPSQDVEKLVEEIVAKSKKPRLRTLLWPGASLKNFGKGLDKIFKTVEYIRVLDLSSSSLEELPQSVTKLKLLRHLDLSNTEIGVLPDSICNLYNLQTLKLLGCVWLSELPKDLGKLVNLLHLELNDIFWYHCTELPPNMGRITGLHNMHVFPVGASGHGIEELKNMEYLTGNLRISKLENAVNAVECKLSEKGKLKKVVLEWSEEFVNQLDEVAVRDLLEDLRPHSDLEELEIHHFKGSSCPSWLIGGDLKNLVTLSLNHCTKCRTLSVGQLNRLKNLYIKGMLDLKEWSEVDQCTSLRKLKISNCPELRMLPYSMPKLKSLKIKNCHSLKALPIIPEVKFLVLIDNPVLEDWRETTSFFVVIELKIINCPKIPALPMNFGPLKLEIDRCELLTDLIESHFLDSLQHLALDTCSNKKILMKILQNSSLKSLVISSVSNLPSLSKELHLPSLETLYISNCEELTSLAEEGGSLRIFSSLKLLSVRGCPELKSLPDDLPTALECLIIGCCHLLKSLGSGHTLQSLPSLKDIYIEDCPSLMSFPKEGLPASLQHLLIQGCPQLTAKCQKEGAEWEKIQNVPDLEIDSINTSSAKDVPK